MFGVRTRHGYLRDQREVEGVGVTFALVLEAVLVPPAALADALRPRWTLLAEIALLRHQLTVLQRSVTRPRVTRFARAPRSLGPSAPDWPQVRSLNRRCVNPPSVRTCTGRCCPGPTADLANASRVWAVRGPTFDLFVVRKLDVVRVAAAYEKTQQFHPKRVFRHHRLMNRTKGPAT